MPLRSALTSSSSSRRSSSSVFWITSSSPKATKRFTHQMHQPRALRRMLLRLGQPHVEHLAAKMMRSKSRARSRAVALAAASRRSRTRSCPFLWLLPRHDRRSGLYLARRDTTSSFASSRRCEKSIRDLDQRPRRSTSDAPSPASDRMMRPDLLLGLRALEEAAGRFVVHRYPQGLAPWVSDHCFHLLRASQYTREEYPRLSVFPQHVQYAGNVSSTSLGPSSSSGSRAALGTNIPHSE